MKYWNVWFNGKVVACYDSFAWAVKKVYSLRRKHHVILDDPDNLLELTSLGGDYYTFEDLFKMD